MNTILLYLFLEITNLTKSTMNKSELIDAIAAESGLTKVDSKKALEAIVTSISKALKANDNVGLTGFGTFKSSVRAARTGRNPSTGKEIQIAAKKVVSFKVGKELAESVQ
jgi:DNA-binding protein HU-beta